jgi:hypothetical protein
MQSCMGYLFDPTFIQSYRGGGWEIAKYTEVAVGITDAQFQIDNTTLYAALTRSTRNRARRYLLDDRETMDGLKVWLKLQATFSG